MATTQSRLTAFIGCQSVSPSNAIFFDSALRSADSPYIFIDSQTRGPRRVNKYMLQNSQDETLGHAVNRILRLLRDNPNLVATFETENPNGLKLRISQERYLTINGDAVCLSAERTAPGIANTNFKDRYFSEALLREPVICSSGHCIERSSAIFWRAARGDLCPAGPHSMGDLRINEELQADIESFRTEKENETRNQDNILRRQAAHALILHSQNAQINRLRNTPDLVLIGGAAGKIVVKLGARKLLITAGKQIAQRAGKTAATSVSKSIAKKIPVACLVFGVAFAAYRIYQGVKKGDKSEFVKAGFEIASGAVAFIPVVGTGLSVAIDMGMAVHDVYITFQDNDNVSFFINTEQAYDILAIERDLESENNIPSREQVDQAYRKQIANIHPDKLVEMGDLYVENGTPMAKIINEARENIYKARGWS